MNFPKEMVRNDRWMLSDGAKAPYSIRTEEPDGYGGERPWFRSRWGCPTQWADFDAALAALHTDAEARFLCFVLLDNDPVDKWRFVCFDFDGAYQNGQLDPDVAAFVDEVNGYTERSKSGRGLHVFVRYYGGPMKSGYQLPFAGLVKLDVIVNSHVVVTGDVLPGRDSIGTISADFLAERFGIGVKTIATQDFGDCWDFTEKEIPAGKEYLATDMLEWEPCIEGYGGDKEFFKAACHLARHGVTGELAKRLLDLVPAEPKFSHAEVTHKIESAYRLVCEEGEFDGWEPDDLEARGRRKETQFEAVEADAVTVETVPTVVRGFEGLEIAEHFDQYALAKMPAFILQDLMFETGALVIGGQNKTFKTTIGLDLLVSVATGKPFLNAFPVECKTKRIAVFSSETREFLMTQYLSTILQSKEIGLDAFHKSFTINSAVPVFMVDKNNRVRCSPRFKEYLKTKQPEIVFFDPLYRMFGGINQADISSMGQALEYVEELCRDFGATPFFCHHSRKPNTMQAGEFPVMTLNDLSGAGGGAFARQWLLLSHTQRFTNGEARLVAGLGASGADDQQWIVKLQTYDHDRNRIWSPQAIKWNLKDEIIHRLTHDGPSTIKQLARKTSSDEYQVEKLVHSEDGIFEMMNNTISLISQTTGEQEF